MGVFVSFIITNTSNSKFSGAWGKYTMEYYSAMKSSKLFLPTVDVSGKYNLMEGSQTHKRVRMISNL
jgi:hypothetical protein